VLNNNISKLSLEQSLEKTIVPTIDPHILARIILYYDIQNQLKFSIVQIKQGYEQEYFIQAENL
ncbi:17871_t:CDS:1, partial [Gigaspora margarita]